MANLNPKGSVKKTKMSYVLVAKKTKMSYVLRVYFQQNKKARAEGKNVTLKLSWDEWKSQ